MLASEIILTFSTALDTGYLVCCPTKHRKSECEGHACLKSLFTFGEKQANTSHTFVLVAVDAEADEATQQEQEEKAAGDSSCNASNGRATQPVSYSIITRTNHHWPCDYKCLNNLTIWHTWTNSVELRWLSFSHTSFGDHPKPVCQAGIEGKDVCAPGRTRFLLDGAKSVRAASSLGAITTFAQEVWSFHLDIKPFVKAHAILFCLILTSRLINH